jgi:hypothetical protein
MENSRYQDNTSGRPKTKIFPWKAFKFQSGSKFLVPLSHVFPKELQKISPFHDGSGGRDVNCTVPEESFPLHPRCLFDKNSMFAGKIWSRGIANYLISGQSGPSASPSTHFREVQDRGQPHSVGVIDVSFAEVSSSAVGGVVV